MRRPARVVLVLVVAAGTAACGVRAQDDPEILRSPPPAPTATPTSTEQPTGITPSGSSLPSPTG